MTKFDPAWASQGGKLRTWIAVCPINNLPRALFPAKTLSLVEQPTHLDFSMFRARRCPRAEAIRLENQTRLDNARYDELFCHLNQDLPMHLGILVTAVFVFALPALANAQTWTSPDGFLSITPPDANTFTAMPEPPPPFVGLWVSNDNSMRFGVTTMQIPPTIKLMQSSAEQGLAKEIGGPVTRLPMTEVSGHEVWNMTATGPTGEVTQAMVRHGGTLYKVMAATVGSTADNETVNRFIGSLSIAEQSDVQLSKLSAVQPVKDLGGGVDLHNLSKTIGGAGALLGIGLLLFWVIRGKNSRQS